MKKDKISKKLNGTVISLFIIGIFIITILVSYALSSFNVTLLGNKQHQINVCGLKMNVKEDDPINIVAAYPIKDNEIESFQPYIITVTNNKTNCYDISFSITMDYCDDNALTNQEDFIDTSLIKYQAKNVTTNKTVTGNDPTTMNLTGLVNSTNTSNIIEIKLWIDSKATNSDLYISDGSGGYETNPDGSFNTKEYCTVAVLNASAQ